MPSPHLLLNPICTEFCLKTKGAHHLSHPFHPRDLHQPFCGLHKWRSYKNSGHLYLFLWHRNFSHVHCPGGKGLIFRFCRSWFQPANPWDVAKHPLRLMPWRQSISETMHTAGVALARLCWHGECMASKTRGCSTGWAWDLASLSISSLDKGLFFKLSDKAYKRVSWVKDARAFPSKEYNIIWFHLYETLKNANSSTVSKDQCLPRDVWHWEIFGGDGYV